MHYAARIFAGFTLLLAFLVNTPAGAGQLLDIAAIKSDASMSSATAAGGQIAVPGYFKPATSGSKNSPDETESNGILWLLLAGVGFGLAFFWWRRYSRASATLLDMHRRVGSAAHIKPAAGRVAYAGRAVGHEELNSRMPLDQATMVKVEELSSVEEEAEVFLLLGRMDKAIGVLRHHVESNDAAQANVWMSLLDILHAHGLRQEFEKLAPEIRERFNVALPTWEGANARCSGMTGLEHFPHIFAKISGQWREPQCIDYIHGLLQDNRSGERGGFHMEAFRDLLSLIRILEQAADPE